MVLASMVATVVLAFLISISSLNCLIVNSYSEYGFTVGDAASEQRLAPSSRTSAKCASLPTSNDQLLLPADTAYQLAMTFHHASRSDESRDMRLASQAHRRNHSNAGWLMAVLIDSRLVRRCQAQKFGTQCRLDLPSGTWRRAPAQDVVPWWSGRNSGFPPNPTGRTCCPCRPWRKCRGGDGRRILTRSPRRRPLWRGHPLWWKRPDHSTADSASRQSNRHIATVEAIHGEGRRRGRPCPTLVRHS